MMFQLRHFRFLVTLIALLAFLTACGEKDTPPMDSDSLLTDSVTETESLTETVTEVVTEAETLLELKPAEAIVEDGFSVTEIYHIPPNTKEETVNVSLPGGPIITVNASSTFYGTESAIDRDSHHLGDMIRYSPYRMTPPDSDFRIEDLDGDRFGDILTFVDGVLTVRKMSNRSMKLVYTQDLGFNGVLCGAGLFDGDLYPDILLCTDTQHLVLGIGSTEGFTYSYVGNLPFKEGDKLYTGDFDADGQEDLIVINDRTVTTYRYQNGAFVLNRATMLYYAEAGQYITYAVGDINSDGADDVIAFMKDPDGSKTADGNDVYGTCTYMSRLDGQFGTYEGDENNQNVNVIHINADGILPLYVAGGDITGDGVDDIAMTGTLLDTGRTYFYSGVYPEEAPAYDYSSHIIKTDEGYILYTGGLYVDYNTDKYPQTDGDHIVAYTSKDGITWHRNLDAACFYLGNELGVGSGNDLTPGTYENWWAGNTMEPEVLFVDGVYYMYYQCEYYQLDKNGQLMGADRIGVATSTDGIHFERKTDSPAIISSDIYSAFTHEEVIYVPDDPDGKCFWMYVRYVHNNIETKRIRIRSADPLCFNMDEDYTECSGLNHVGNQIGYISNYDGQGNRLFVRITMDTYAEGGDPTKAHWVPSLQFSADGVNWILANLHMAGTNLDINSEAKRNNIFFLGFSTINGTGELARTEDGEAYEFYFVGGTGESSVAPGIFYSSEGGGYVRFTVDVKV